MFISPIWFLRFEGLIVLISSIIVYHLLDGSWILFAVFFFVPDIFMVGYLINKEIGASIYNFGHTYIVPFLLWLVLYLLHLKTLYFIVLIWIGHIGFDRLLGYGLKYSTGFKDTHLGKL